MPTLRTGKGRKAGFTLLELLLVLAIIGLATALVAPRMVNQTRLGHQDEILQIHSLFKQASREAIIQGRPQTAALVFPGPAWEQTGTEPNGTRPLQLNHSRRENGGREAVFQVTFFPEGGSSGGRLVLVPPDRPQPRTVLQFSPLTGKITISTDHGL